MKKKRCIMILGILSILVLPNIVYGLDCTDVVDPELLEIIREIFRVGKFAIPVALIIFGCMDFTGPILSNDRDALSKATSKFVKRCIVGVVIFFIPTILNYIFNIYNEIVDDPEKQITNCEIVMIERW